MRKFDGPQFINPLHTSFGQISGTYQNPLEYTIPRNSNTKEIYSSKKKPGSDWSEEETKELKKYNNINNKLNSDNIKSLISSEEISNKYVVFEYENKLIEDLLTHQGISLKPSGSLLEEFLKKSKTLNKQKISKFLIEKISELINLTDKNSINKIIKSLYIIEALLQKQNEVYYELFLSNTKIFGSLASQHTNHKIHELSNSILNLIGSTEFNGLEIRNKISFEDKKEPKKEFAFIKTKKISNKNINIDNLKEIDTNLFSINDLKDNCKKVEDEKIKHAFSFIKSNNEPNICKLSSNHSINSQINEIFSLHDNFSEVRNKNIQSTNLLNLDELYAEEKETFKNNKRNLTNFSINYHENYNIDLSDLTTVPISQENKKIRLEKIAEENNESASKSNVDHFNFVKDLMKKKL